MILRLMFYIGLFVRGMASGDNATARSKARAVKHPAREVAWTLVKILFFVGLMVWLLGLGGCHAIFGRS